MLYVSFPQNVIFRCEVTTQHTLYLLKGTNIFNYIQTLLKDSRKYDYVGIYLDVKFQPVFEAAEVLEK